MYRLSFAAIIFVLASCAAPAPAFRGVFRDSAAPIYSSAVLEADRLQGRWIQSAAFMAPDSAECRAGGVDITRKPTGLTAVLRLCLSGAETRASGALKPAGPGRFVLTGAAKPGLGEPWWVLWADADYRTLVIGTPSGRFGFILNRAQGSLSPDRLVAAREILDWNGYDLDQLRVFAR